MLKIHISLIFTYHIPKNLIVENVTVRQASLLAFLLIIQTSLIPSRSFTICCSFGRKICASLYSSRRNCRKNVKCFKKHFWTNIVHLLGLVHYIRHTRERISMYFVSMSVYIVSKVCQAPQATGAVRVRFLWEECRTAAVKLFLFCQTAPRVSICCIECSIYLDTVHRPPQKPSSWPMKYVAFRRKILKDQGMWPGKERKKIRVRSELDRKWNALIEFLTLENRRYALENFRSTPLISSALIAEF